MSHAQGKETVFHSPPTYTVFWFPANPKLEGNIYAEDGPLHKYDEVFGAKSQAYELKHNVSDKDWVGHCDKAAMVVSLLKEPKRSVTFGGITFTPYDIKGLLVKVIDTVPHKFTWLGKRYPEGPLSDPRPKQVYEKLKEWNELKRPVIVDVDANVEVWCYPMSKFTFDFDNRVMEMSSEGFPEQDRQYLIEWNQNAWIRELRFDASKNPDFLWMVEPEVDLYKRENWPEKKTESTMLSLHNPHISPRRVFDVYIRSIDAE